MRATCYVHLSFGLIVAEIQIVLPISPLLVRFLSVRYVPVTVVCCRYAGPNSVQISDAFTLGWGAYLTTNRSIIYALIDGRGSGLKGDSMKFSVYRRLGTVEIYDQITATV